VLWRTEDGVRLQSRTGRDVTALWMDLAVAAMRLPPGVVLDGVM
jgi:ATP-dependent DNA ligase